MNEENVQLTWWEIWLAAEVARQRLMDNFWKHAREVHGADSELGGLDLHFMGCVGELATAKYLGLYWSGNVGRKDVPDVGRTVQVRATKWDDLRLHRRDKDYQPFVLAIVRVEALPSVCLRGWMFARDGKLDQFWGDKARNGRPAFFVPGELPPLRPMRELIHRP